MLPPPLPPTTAMRLLMTAACLLAVLSVSARAEDDTARRPQLSSQQCGLSTDYNVLVDGGGVWLYRDSGSPKEVFFHDGELSVDRQVRPVSAADAQRLRELESASRALMPQIAAIARDSVDITFDSLASVVEVLTGSKRKARRLDGFRKETLAHVDGTLGTGRWDQDVFGDGFDEKIEAAADSIASSIGRSVLWSVFTGGAKRIEARAERMEAELERSLDARVAAIEAKGAAMCGQVATMHALQSALEYRHDGQPLRLIEVSTRSEPSNGDRARETAIAPSGQ